MDSDELVSLHLFLVNLVHHCSAGPTARGDPRLVRLIIIIFFFKNENKNQTKKIMIKKYFVNPFHGVH